jgi:hypothetical protein
MTKDKAIENLMREYERSRKREDVIDGSKLADMEWLLGKVITDLGDYMIRHGHLSMAGVGRVNFRALGLDPFNADHVKAVQLCVFTT